MRRAKRGIASPLSPRGYPLPSHRSWWCRRASLIRRFPVFATSRAPTTTCWFMIERSLAVSGPSLCRMLSGNLILPTSCNTAACLRSSRCSSCPSSSAVRMTYCSTRREWPCVWGSLRSNARESSRSTSSCSSGDLPFSNSSPRSNLRSARARRSHVHIINSVNGNIRDCGRFRHQRVPVAIAANEDVTAIPVATKVGAAAISNHRNVAVGTPKAHTVAAAAVNGDGCTTRSHMPHISYRAGSPARAELPCPPFANQYPTTEETRIDPSGTPTLEGAPARDWHYLFLPAAVLTSVEGGRGRGDTYREGPRSSGDR